MNRFTATHMSRCLAPCLFFAAAVPGLAVAQESGQGPANEIKLLFERVEKDLQEIDKLLLEASREPRPAGAPEAGKPREAAKSAHNKQKGVSEAIQKILDLIPPSSGS
jgi:hypothetical protein